MEEKKINFMNGVTGNILMEISYKNNYTSKIIKSLGITNSHAIKMIQKLEDNEIITRQKEGRLIKIKLTNKGKEIQNHLKAIRELI